MRWYINSNSNTNAEHADVVVQGRTPQDPIHDLAGLRPQVDAPQPAVHQGHAAHAAQGRPGHQSQPRQVVVLLRLGQERRGLRPGLEQSHYGVVGGVERARAGLC